MPSDASCSHRGQFTLRSLFLLTFSVAIGLSFWRIERDWHANITPTSFSWPVPGAGPRDCWYTAVLAAASCWIVFGLAAQVHDIRRAFRLNSHATTDERWGRRFALAWRLAVCFLIVASFAFQLLFRFHVIVENDRGDSLGVSSLEMWDAVLFTSIIAAIAGSFDIGRHVWRRPWSWGLYIFRGFAVAALFLLLMEGRQIVAYLVHVTIVAILAAQPLMFESDVVFAASRAGEPVLRHFSSGHNLNSGQLHLAVAVVGMVAVGRTTKGLSVCTACREPSRHGSVHHQDRSGGNPHYFADHGRSHSCALATPGCGRVCACGGLGNCRRTPLVGAAGGRRCLWKSRVAA